MLSVISVILLVVCCVALLWAVFAFGRLIGWYDGWEEAWNLIHDFERVKSEKKNQKESEKGNS